MHKYILRGHTPVRCDDVIAWGRWFETADRRVAFADVTSGVTVSTVFLGLDHNFASDGPPLLFESMIFGGPQDGYQDRCSTWEEAEKMHSVAVAIARRSTLRVV